MSRRTACIRCRAGLVQHANQCCYRRTLRLHACAAPVCLSFRTDEAPVRTILRPDSGLVRGAYTGRPDSCGEDCVEAGHPGDVGTCPRDWDLCLWAFHVKQLPLLGPREPCPPRRSRKSHACQSQRCLKAEKCWSTRHGKLNWVRQDLTGYMALQSSVEASHRRRIAPTAALIAAQQHTPAQPSAAHPSPAQHSPARRTAAQPSPPQRNPAPQPTPAHPSGAQRSPPHGRIHLRGAP